jgi:hypothetical protein
VSLSWDPNYAERQVATGLMDLHLLGNIPHLSPLFPFVLTRASSSFTVYTASSISITFVIAPDQPTVDPTPTRAIRTTTRFLPRILSIRVAVAVQIAPNPVSGLLARTPPYFHPN